MNKLLYYKIVIENAILLDKGDYTDAFNTNGDKGAASSDKNLTSLTNSIYSLFFTLSLIGLAISVLTAALYMVLNSTNLYVC